VRFGSDKPILVDADGTCWCGVEPAQDGIRTNGDGSGEYSAGGWTEVDLLLCFGDV
jgi:hypothetical protein